MSHRRTFTPVRTEARHDAATAAAVHLRRVAGPDASGIRVHQQDNTVHLTGRVPQWHLKQLATAAVRAADSSVEISNELLVAN